MTDGVSRIRWRESLNPWSVSLLPCIPPRNHADCDAVLSGHSHSLLAQFGLTPKSRRGLAAGEVV